MQPQNNDKYLHLTIAYERFLIMNDEDKTNQTAVNRISYIYHKK